MCVRACVRACMGVHVCVCVLGGGWEGGMPIVRSSNVDSTDRDKKEKKKRKQINVGKEKTMVGNFQTLKKS